SIRYHLVSGPGEVDARTGVWVLPPPDDFRVRIRAFDVEIAASIGNSDIWTSGDENCRFRVYVGGNQRPKILVDGDAYPSAFMVDAPGTRAVQLSISDPYNCSVGLSIESVEPQPVGQVTLDDNWLLTFEAAGADINQRFLVRLRAENPLYVSYTDVLFDTRTSPTVPTFVDCPDSIVGADCESVEYTVKAVDPEYGDTLGIRYEIVSGPGSIHPATGEWRFHRFRDYLGQTLDIEIAARYGPNSTSGEENCRFKLSIAENFVPDFALADDSPCGKELTITAPGDTTFDIMAVDSNACHFVEYFLSEVSPPNELITLTRDPYKKAATMHIGLQEQQAGQLFTITVGATDGLDTAFCTFRARGTLFQPIQVLIGLTGGAYPQTVTSVDVNLIWSAYEIGGFDFLFGYDASAIAFQQAVEGPPFFGDDGCKWEYFTYRYGPDGDCKDKCPSGVLRVVGIAETNNGPNNHPNCNNPDFFPATLFTLDFKISSYPKYECHFAPIRFLWTECTDNALASWDGWDVYVSGRVFDLEHPHTFIDITNTEDPAGYPTFAGAQDDDCFGNNPGGNQVLRYVDFYDGGIKFASDTIDPRGDVNLNEIPFEIADFVLFKNYFRFGLEVFKINVDGQVATTDVNGDGATLTVEDLVYMARVIVGDALPLGMLEPCSDTAVFTHDEGAITLEFNSPDSLGAVFLVVEGDVTPSLAPGLEMDLDYNFMDGCTRILVYALDAGSSIHSGPLMTLSGEGTLKEAYAATYMGAKVNTQIVSPSPSGSFGIRIEKKEEVLQGTRATLAVTMDKGVSQLEGFTMLLAYDKATLSLVEVNPATDLFGETGCDWEYFTYLSGPNVLCGNNCSPGLVRVYAVADINDGPKEPSCYLPGSFPANLFGLVFQVTNDRNYECAFLPVSFYWIECSDNVLNGFNDSIFVSNNVYDADGNNITGPDETPTYKGFQTECVEPAYGLFLREVDFYSGGIHTICADSIDARGDVNLNGISFEIADCVLFASYFLNPHPGDIFKVNTAGQIAATDVNMDDVPLTIDDLVYMARVIAGDLHPMTEPGICADTAYFRQTHKTISVEFNSLETLGAVYLVVKGIVDVTPLYQSDLNFAYNIDGNFTRILIYGCGQSGYLESGPLVWLTGGGTLVEASTATYMGDKVTSKIDVALGGDDEDSPNLPTRFALYQNYPNPFNASTVIDFDLPRASEVAFEVFSVLGKTVFSRSGYYSPGRHQIRWDGVSNAGSTVASGVYYYRLKAGSSVDTRKMVLLK
ncbi:MAG: T9SS type A sorting domain-containing protein, partial [candidate division Zixibacteria bacterium]|nr:T9SS type A sorting domain-containing protein [candidate division Zixibacteria bacterium]